MTATILVVDDIESNLEIIKEKLLDEYYIVCLGSDRYETPVDGCD